MEEWYAELSKKNLRGNFAVTGYSLDGHLATAFNLLHPGAAKEVVTFNGAGVGKAATGDVTSAMKIFGDMRSNTTLIDDRLKPSGAALLYRTIKKNLADGTWKVEDALKNAEHALSLERLMNPDNGGTDTDLGVKSRLVINALYKYLRLVLLPFLERLNRRLGTDGTLRNVVVVQLQVVEHGRLQAGPAVESGLL